MGRVLTNNFSMSVAIEDSIGVLPAQPVWRLQEPNDVTTFGSDITKVARDPISKLRQRRKGATTDLDSAVEFEHDVTVEVLDTFLPGFVFALPVGVKLESGTNLDSLAAANDPPPVGTDSGYTHDALPSALDAGTLVFARNFTTPANNGLTDVIAGGDASNTLVSKVLTDETPTLGQNATLEVAGVRAATGDLSLTVTGTTATLDSTILDLSGLGLSLGQFIHVGGLTPTEQFTEGAGPARVIGISTNQLVLDKLGANLATAAGAGDTVDLLFGRFYRNVPTDDPDYIERSYTFEGEYPNLQDPGPGDEYEYPKGNLSDALSFNLPLTDKATMTVGLIGTDTTPPSSTRETNANDPVLPQKTVAFGTSSDILRLRIQNVDETGLTTDFKDTTVTLGNNVSPEKVLGTLGARYMNAGNFEVDIETQIVFTNGDVITAIRENRTVTMDWSIRNDDGAVWFDVPSLTLSGGGREFPRNESVLANLTGEAFVDDVLGTSIGVSLFPVYPSS